MVVTLHLCDECGDLATYATSLETGRVEIQGRDEGQFAEFCDAHKPRWEGPLTSIARWQPNNCQRVRFRWDCGDIPEAYR